MISIDGVTISYEGAGLFLTDEPWIHPRIAERDYELIYVTQGTVYLREGDAAYELQKDDLILLQRGVIHEGARYSQGRTGFYWVHFQCADLQSLYPHGRLLRQFAYQHAFRKLLHFACSGLMPGYAGDVQVLDILSEMYRVKAEDTLDQSKLLNEVFEYIRLHICRRPSVGQIAAHFSYSAEHLSRVFKRSMGMGLKAYIDGEMIKKVKELLCNTNYSIKQISGIMNFDNSNLFINFFQYHEGKSPSAFREAYRRIHMNNH